ncbi:MAG TPA: RGCVC family protein [Pseudonocardiaceae bacterium]
MTHRRRDTMVTPMTGAQSDTTTADSGDRPAGMCAACPHPEDNHDVIGQRYCSATIAGGWERGCVCGGDRGAATHRPRIRK